MSDTSGGAVPGSFAVDPSRDMHGQDAAALRLHAANRHRAAHFGAPVMADSAMDILLSLLLARSNARAPSVAALALAHGMTPDKCHDLIGQMVQAGLVLRAGDGASVRLSQRGERLLRDYLMSEEGAA